MTVHPLFDTLLRRLKVALPILYCMILVGVNLYICRGMFFTEYTGHMNSMHGFWIGMARLAPASHWIKPTWWPFWYGGMPFEYTYAPLVPDLAAAYAKFTGFSPARGYHAVSGFFYCMTPPMLFVVAWKITQSPGYSFAAGLAYSLLSPTELLVPDSSFKFSNLGNARRLFLTVVWDETPHMVSVSFALLVILFLSLSFRKRRPIFYLLTGIFMAASVLSNAFGGTMILIVTLCLAFALEGASLRSNVLLALGIGSVSYMIISPWFPPSLVETIRFNAHRFEGGWTFASLTAFLAVALGWLALWRALRRWIHDWPLRFFALFAYATGSIPLLAAYANRHFLPQPGRYKVEMEIALVLLTVFIARAAMAFLKPTVRIALALALLFFAGEQLVSHRRFAKQIIRSVNVSETIEWRAARWVEGRFPVQRAMMPGSIGQWLNAFTETPNFAGGSFPTAPNWTQQVALYNVYAGRDGQESLTWLKAFGVQAAAVSGPASQEFWKPYSNPMKFEGLLPVVRQQDDVTLYRIPQRDPSLAHVVPSRAITRPSRGEIPELSEVRNYVAALDDPALPSAEVRWDGWNRALIRTIAQKDQVISLQINYHPGWHARSNGRAAPILRDGLGLLCIRPDCSGTCVVELAYDGGWEYKLCRWLSVLALAGLLVGLSAATRSRPRLKPSGGN